MNILKQLTPAETQLIINVDCEVGELLKLTFIDLLMRQVLKMEVAEEIIKYYRISTGINFQTYAHKLPGSLFTHIFLEDPELSLSPYELKRIIKEQFKDQKAFKKNFYVEPQLAEYFKPFPSGFYKRFAKIKLNEQGKQLQARLIEYFDNLKSQFSTSLSQEQMNRLYAEVGTNVLLITGFESTALSFQFQKEEKDKREDNSGLYTENSAYYTSIDNNTETLDIPDSPSFDPDIFFDILKSIENAAESISETFGPNFDSSDTGGGGDSGGDSGCSGCGGCGGD